MHSNLKEKRQILRDTVNHIQTIHKEKGDRRKKNRKGLLTKILNFLHMGKHTMPFKIHVLVTSKVKVKKTYSNVEHLMVSVKENCYYTIKDYVMVVTGALHHVKFQ